MVLWESNEYFAMFLIKVLKPIVAVCNNETMIAFIICLMGTSGGKKVNVMFDGREGWGERSFRVLWESNG